MWGAVKSRLPNLKKIVKACDRKKAGMTAPAKGLFLEKVIY